MRIKTCGLCCTFFRERHIMKNQLALIGGTILTMEDSLPECSGVLIEKGRITAVGSSDAVAALARERKAGILDLKGKTAVPGLHDCHVHVMGTGLNATGIDLFDCATVDEVLDKLREGLKSPGEDWIYGTRLDESRLREKRPPTAKELDALSGRRGIFLVDRGLHYTLVNTASYTALGLKGDEPGVVRGSDGRPNGRLHGQANGIARSYYNNQMSDARRREAIRYTVQQALAKGVTTIHGMEGGDMFSDADIPVLLDMQGHLPLDIVLYWDTENVEAVRDTGLRSMGTDLLLDGSIGSRTAAFDEPYADDPSSRGVLYFDSDTITGIIERALKYGLQSGFHAIGQRGIRQVLDCFEAACARCPVPDHRFRIEHFGFPDQRDIDRAVRLGVVVSTQPAFTYLRGGPGSVYNERTGEARERRAYPMRRFLEAGIVLGGGSDSGVTPIDPVLGIHAAVNPPYEENSITARQALRMFTIDGAYTAFEEKEKGSIAAGKWGDLTILSDNPLAVDPRKIKDIAVEMTVKKGEIVYNKGEE